MVQTEKNMIQFTSQEINSMYACIVTGPKSTDRGFDFDKIYEKEEIKKKLSPFIKKAENGTVVGFNKGAISFNTEEKAKIREWLKEVTWLDSAGDSPLTAFQKLG